MNRHLLILDIDETLLFATEKPLAHLPDYVVGPYSVYKRPYVDDFLQAVAGVFDLAIWTSSGEDYAARVIRPLFPNSNVLKFVWSRDRCTRRFNHESQEDYWVKDLKKAVRAGFPIEQILVVDDSPEKLQRHYGNHVRVSPFTGGVHDKELLQLVPFLRYMSTVQNVRVIEKRNWRSFSAPESA